MKKPIKISLLLLIFNFSFLIFNFFSLPPQVPLFYSRPWGEEQLAEKFSLLILPGGAGLILLFNAKIASSLLESEPLLARILLWSSVLVSLLASVAIFKICSLLI